MKSELAEAVRQALADGETTTAVALVERDGQLAPKTISRADDPAIESIHVGDKRYPMASFAIMLLPLLEGNLIVPVRECDRRMLVELEKHNQVDIGRLRMIEVPCSEELASKCVCDHPQATFFPEASSDDPTVRLSFWLDAFSRCVRCMGCRNICPMCYCKECALDNPDLVNPGAAPPDTPIFHLIRAFDMADRCVDCGMCETICPAEIPLRQLYRQTRAIPQ
ncbi:MAG: hypothetical protein CVT63_05910 [Candidatus Anoxymicrobium japonicum]|uniref:4Fe-4S ferredoxin-type domain-containing protein n=1 Tax=Candidatus Anoxymicrobium japonicum TaxID=2013648 RepID=A0A2N3G544_9ACTN|nr:MAG: hypothetical protein CVT63_05910 [Candidatus Anoxymicrobium japonicum]